MTSAMQIATIPGETYAVTVTSPCTVCAVMPKSSPLLLITIEDPGQYLVVAPTTALYIDDDSALVTRSFKSAPVGMFSRKVPSGGAIGQESIELSLAPDGPRDNLNSCGFAFAVEEAGILRSIAIEGRTGYEFHKNPVWMKLWRAVPGAVPVWLAVSLNSVIQQNNALNTWDFEEGVLLRAGDRLAATTHREEGKVSREFSVDGADGKLLARVCAIPATEGIGCLDDSGSVAWNYLPSGTITLSREANLADYAQVAVLDESVFGSTRKRPQTLYVLRAASSPSNYP